MPGTTTPLSPALTLLPTGSDSALTCECIHRGVGAGPCGRPASARVTIVCIAETCDCAASVHLLCPDCLAVWKENARRDGVELRIAGL